MVDCFNYVFGLLNGLWCCEWIYYIQHDKTKQRHAIEQPYRLTKSSYSRQEHILGYVPNNFCLVIEDSKRIIVLFRDTSSRLLTPHREQRTYPEYSSTEVKTYVEGKM